MKRNKFNLSYTKLLSCDMGELVPIGLMEVLPGDSIMGATSALVRAAPLLAPVMHPTDVTIHHWYVPHRLVWTDWENFITGGPDGLNASVAPTITFPNGGPEVGTLADYLGVPTDIVQAAGTPVSALPFRGYAKIWNEWYRDQDLQTALTIDLTDGPDTTTNTTLQFASWRKDYFTSARPWEQKGAAVTIPVSGSAPVVFSEGAPTPQTVTFQRNAAGPSPLDVTQAGTNDSAITGAANLTGVSITMNQLRQAAGLQRFEEARARYGSRYPEYLMQMFGVRSSDARLQRPEYLGGGKQTIQFSEVLATAEGASTDVGDLKGHGIAALRSNRFKKFFEEHGFVFTLMVVRPKAIYMDGLDRHWNKTSKTDYWQRELQHIGQQAILNKEVRASHATPNGTFGYQDRYDEYRKAWSKVSGEFRQTLLNFWHMARDFSSDPALNSTFVSCVPTDRIFAVPSQDIIYVHARHSFLARRCVAAVGSSHLF